MGISAPLRARPFSVGSIGTSTLVPYKYHVSLGGRPYMIDTVRAEEWRHETVPLLRQQSDQSAAPGEASLNPEALWRRSWASWHKGAGQTHRDRDDANPNRFRDSRGVNIWTRYQLSLLPAVDQKRTSSNTNLKMVVAGNRLFLVDGADVVYTEDVTVDSPTWTACTNEPGGTILDVATDGEYIWITDGSNSFWADASASPPAFNLAGWTGTQDADVLAFVKGRLVSAHDNTLHTYDAAGVATAITIAAVLPTTYRFVGFAGGPTNAVIYAAGFLGDKSTIYRIGIAEDGTGLSAAIPAGELPDGEIIRSIGSYLGQVLLGTDNGVRFATPDAAGNLTIGALIETGKACRCFEGQGPWVWFGWDAFDASHTGLGRLSLEEFSSTDRLAPAYASDLMAGVVGETSSVVTFQDIRVFAVEGTSMGVYGQHTNLEASGYLQSGDFDYGFTGDKTALFVDVTHNSSSGGSHTMELRASGGSYVSLGTHSDDDTPFSTELRARAHEWRITLTSNGTTAGPTISSVTVRVAPAVTSTRLIQVPILLNEHLDPDGGADYLDVGEERDALEGWWQSRELIVYQELERAHSVQVQDLKWFPRLRQDTGNEGHAVDGTMLALLKEVTA